MKALFKLLIVCCLLSACTDDDAGAELSSRELLIRHNWIVFSVALPVVQIPDQEPEIISHVLDFEETGYSGSDFTGTFYELGDWSLEGDVLTLGDEAYPVLELTNKRLVYEMPGGRVVTRLAIEVDM